MGQLGKLTNPAPYSDAPPWNTLVVLITFAKPPSTLSVPITRLVLHGFLHLGIVLLTALILLGPATIALTKPIAFCVSGLACPADGDERWTKRTVESGTTSYSTSLEQWQIILCQSCPHLNQNHVVLVFIAVPFACPLSHNFSQKCIVLFIQLEND